jgi:hypothetical protein
MKEPLLMFPLAILIMTALIGLFIMGFSGGTVYVQGSNHVNLGTSSDYTNQGGNIAWNTSTGEPNTADTRDSPTDSVPASTWSFQGTGAFILIAGAVGAALLGVIALAGISGVTILGSGNAGLTNIVYNYAGWGAIWLVLSAASASIFFGDTPLGIGLIFYAILSMMFFIGTLTHYRGTTS